VRAYAKSIAAAVGLLAIVGKEVLGFEVPQETVDQVVNGILALGTWLAVFGLSNK